MLVIIIIIIISTVIIIVMIIITIYFLLSAKNVIAHKTRNGADVKLKQTTEREIKASSHNISRHLEFTTNN